MIGRTNTYIGLDIGSHQVKAVAITPSKGRVTLNGYAQVRIGDQDPAIIIRQVMAQLGLKPRNIVTSVSGRSVIVRQVETPRIKDSDLHQHITYEADKYIPFGADEVVIDCQALEDVGEDVDESRQQVQLVAVRRGFIEDHVSMLNGAGVHPRIIDIDVFALCNAYETFGPKQPEEGNKETVALVDLGASKVCVAIVKGNRPLFTREFYLAGNEITDTVARSLNENPEDIEDLKMNPGEALEALIDAAMPTLEDLANEIRLSFDYVEGQYDESVQSVILTGGTCQLPSLGSILGNILSRPVSIFDPLAGIDLVPSKYDIQTLDSNAPSLTVALGLAAHQLNQDNLGLGGAQLTAWQSRRAGAAAAAAANSASAQVGVSDASGSHAIDDAPPPPPPPQEPVAFNPPPQEEMPQPSVAQIPAMEPPPGMGSGLQSSPEIMAAPDPAEAPAPATAPDPIAPPTFSEPSIAAFGAPESESDPLAAFADDDIDAGAESQPLPVADIMPASVEGTEAAMLPPGLGDEEDESGINPQEDSQAYGNHPHRSSMLVILDDDEEEQDEDEEIDENGLPKL